MLRRLGGHSLCENGSLVVTPWQCNGIYVNKGFKCVKTMPQAGGSNTRPTGFRTLGYLGRPKTIEGLLRDNSQYHKLTIDVVCARDLCGQGRQNSGKM